MAVTITYDYPFPIRMEKGNRGGVGVLTGTITFDDSYPTGGEDIAAIFSKFKSLTRLITNGSGIQCKADYTNQKLLAYYGDNDNAAHAEFVEATNTDNLSAEVVDFLAIGRV